MDSKIALRGSNVSAGSFVRSSTNAARPGARSANPVSLTSGSRQYGLSYTWNNKTYPWSSQNHDHTIPDYPDHRRMYVQEWYLKVAERSIPGLYAPPDYEYQECCDRVARSAGVRSPCVCFFALATLSERGISVNSSGYSRPYSPALPYPRLVSNTMTESIPSVSARSFSSDTHHLYRCR